MTRNSLYRPEPDIDNKENVENVCVNVAASDVKVTAEEHGECMDFSTMTRNTRGRFAHLSALSLDSTNEMEEEEYVLKGVRSVFPYFKLPSASFGLPGHCGGSRKLMGQQIRELFQSPIPHIYCTLDDSEESDEYMGVFLEHALRRCVGAAVPDFEEVTGWLGESNAYKDLIGFDLEGERRQKLAQGQAAIKSAKRRKDDSSFGLMDQPAKRARLEQAPVSDEAAMDLESHLEDTWMVINEPWGSYARAAEEEWQGPSSLKDLYQRKQYLEAGLYSTFFKIAGEAEQIVVDAPPNPFKFPLPTEFGATMLETDKEFELCFPMQRYRALWVVCNCIW